MVCLRNSNQWCARIVAACLLLGTDAGSAAAATPRTSRRVSEVGPEGDETDDAPAPTRFSGATHPDCGNRTPLWQHEVQVGENLGGIAGRYGVRRQELVELNDLENPDFIRSGERLKVCPEIPPRQRKRVELIVQAGDTLSEIAQAHGVTIRELVDEHTEMIADPNRVVAGQRLTFWVDDGLVPEFRPAPEPEPAPKSAPRRRRYSKVRTQLRGDAGVRIKRPHLAYGTEKTIELIRTAVTQYRRREGSGPGVLIGDISRRGGGRLPPHVSHRYGRDVDVGYVLKGEDAKRMRFTGVNHANLDVARTWKLLQSFLATGQIHAIFLDYGHQKLLYEYARAHGVRDEELDELFQYPRGRGRPHGVIRHWKSHRHHFHVRFKS